MALPMNSTPVYKINIPSTGKEITFRPFLVKEEKALLLAQQSESTEIMVNTLKEIIKSCVKEPLDVESLAIFDYEFLFTNIRAKSVGEIVDLIFTCAHCEQENNKVKMSIDLTKIPLVRDPNQSNKIPLFDNVGVIMRYPGLDTLKKAEGNEENLDKIMEVVIDCIDAIYNEDEVFYAKEQTREELNDFVMNLTKQQFDKIESFFANVPQYKQEIEFDCPACGQHNFSVVEGPASFF